MPYNMIHPQFTPNAATRSHNNAAKFGANTSPFASDEATRGHNKTADTVHSAANAVIQARPLKRDSPAVATNSGHRPDISQHGEGQPIAIQLNWLQASVSTHTERNIRKSAKTMLRTIERCNYPFPLELSEVKMRHVDSITTLGSRRNT